VADSEIAANSSGQPLGFDLGGNNINRTFAVVVVVVAVLRVESIFTYSCGATTRIGIHVFRRVNPIYGMDTYIFQVNVFTKQAEHE